MGDTHRYIHKRTAYVLANGHNNNHNFSLQTFTTNQPKREREKKATFRTVPVRLIRFNDRK